MIVDISNLKNGLKRSMDIDFKLEVDQEKLSKSNILEIDDAFVKGSIVRDDFNQYIINVVASGDMMLPCAITLKPVKFEFCAEIEGNIDDLLVEINEIGKKTENSIDILPIIWENVLMEIPMRVVSDETDDIKLEGEGWKFVKDDENTSTNPELEKLKDLLK